LSYKVSIIGAGNVGSFLGLSLMKAGLDIVQVYSRSLGPAKMLASSCGAEAVQELHTLKKNSDLYIIAIPDDEIRGITSEMIDFKGTVVHTSGSVSIDVFRGRAEKFGVFYPLQTFGETKQKKPEQIPFCLEASDRETRKLLEETAGMISKNIYFLDSEQRKAAHLAAVFASNFTNLLYGFSEELLKDSGLSFDLVRPLIEQSAFKVRVSSPENVQTGPASRGDISTMKAHLELLKNKPELFEIYTKFSKLLAKKYTGKDVEL
jgi:predicted short-subunit dehydrogenase-like oxidoreductase (DUF2520 family)